MSLTRRAPSARDRCCGQRPFGSDALAQEHHATAHAEPPRAALWTSGGAVSLVLGINQVSGIALQTAVECSRGVLR